MKKFKAFDAWALSMVLALVGTAPAQVHAEPEQAETQRGATHYITDTLEVPVRSGAGREYRIINLLRSGTPVVILDINEKGWARIQYEWKGKKREAWIPSSLLANEPPPRAELEAAKQRLEAQSLRISQMQTELDNVRREYEQVRTKLNDVQKRVLELKRENEHLRQLAGADLDLDRENRKLREQLKKLEEEKRILEDQITHSEDNIKRQWFLTGAGVLAAGLLLGWLIRPSGRRRSDWSRL